MLERVCGSSPNKTANKSLGTLDVPVQSLGDAFSSIIEASSPLLSHSRTFVMNVPGPGLRSGLGAGGGKALGSCLLPRSIPILSFCLLPASLCLSLPASSSPLHA